MSSIAHIAATLEGYDPDSLSVDGVHAFFDRLVAQPAVTRQDDLPLHAALDRVLACDIVAPFDVPPHDNSAMDGFAFDGIALDQPNAGGADVRLRLAAGTALAGVVRTQGVGPGEAVRIMTGAVMPVGLDTVVPQELCGVADGELLFPSGSVRRGANRRLAGEDLKAGHPALRAGDRLTPAALGLVASAGLATVPVLRRLRVAYFSTGDELLSLGEAPRAGAVYDSNRYTVFGLLARLGCDIVDLGLIRDEPAALEAALCRAAREADAIVTSGGVSAGDADHMRKALEQHGDVAFWRIAMRPGRPMAVGLISRQRDTDSPDARPAVLFGLPGNPVAVMVAFLALVRPALLKMMGCNAASRAPSPLVRARTASAIRKRPGRTEYQRGFVRRVPGDWPEVRIAGNQGSGVLSSMVAANGLVVLRHDQDSVAPGDLVDVMMFDGAI